MSNIYNLNDIKNKKSNEIQKMIQKDKSLEHCNLLIKKINIVIKALEDKEMIFSSEEDKIISTDLEKADIALSNIEDIIIKKLKFGIKEILSEKKE